MKYIWQERVQLIVRIFIYIVLAIFLLRNTIDLFEFFIQPIQKEKIQTRSIAPRETPEGAKYVVKNFLEVLFSSPDVQPITDQNNRYRMLQQWSTAELFSHIRDHRGQNKSVSSVRDEGNKTLIKQIDLLDSMWIDSGRQLVITAVMQREGDHSFYVRVPVIKAGEGWLVNDLPSLIPPPQIEEPNPKMYGQLEPQKQKEIKELLHSFFPKWLEGEQVAVDLYTASGARQRAAPLLENMKGEYLGISEFQVVRMNPIQIKTTVVIDSVLGLLQFTYQITLRSENHQWKIVSMGN